MNLECEPQLLDMKRAMDICNMKNLSRSTRVFLKDFKYHNDNRKKRNHCNRYEKREEGVCL